MPELEAELLAEKEAKKDRSVESRGRLYALKVEAFFLYESEESDERDASLPERVCVTAALDDGPADRSASEMSWRPCPRLDIVLSRSRSALRHCGVLDESVKSGVPGPRSRPFSSSTRRGERADLASCETGMALEETERERVRFARPLRADEELAAADCPLRPDPECEMAS